MKNFNSMMALIITVIVEIIALLYLKKNSYKSNNHLIKSFIKIIIHMIFWCIGLIVQILIINFISEDYAIYADYFVYIFSSSLPISLLIFASAFIDEHNKPKPWLYALYIIPVVIIGVLWTNDIHHLFYEYYSVDFSQTKFGPFCSYIYTPYSYITIAIALFLMLKSSIKKTSIVSIQTILFITSILIPLVINIAGSINLIPMSIYATPISFSASIIILRNSNI